VGQRNLVPGATNLHAEFVSEVVVLINLFRDLQSHFLVGEKVSQKCLDVKREEAAQSFVAGGRGRSTEINVSISERDHLLELFRSEIRSYRELSSFDPSLEINFR